jgi:hypothetical protein
LQVQLRHAHGQPSHLLPSADAALNEATLLIVQFESEQALSQVCGRVPRDCAFV